MFETLEYEIKLFSLLSSSFLFPILSSSTLVSNINRMLAVFLLFCSLHITTYFNLTIFKSYITFNYGIINGGVCAENQLNFNHLFNKKTDSKRISYNKLCMNLKYNWIFCVHCNFLIFGMFGFIGFFFWVRVWMWIWRSGGGFMWNILDMACGAIYLFFFGFLMKLPKFWIIFKWL